MCRIFVLSNHSAHFGLVNLTLLASQETSINSSIRSTEVEYVVNGDRERSSRDGWCTILGELNMMKSKKRWNIMERKKGINITLSLLMKAIKE
ncbi:hypothetical protein LguiB_017429 [Lonicera macranthoides]